MCPSPRQALGLLLPKRLVKRQLEERLRKQSILGMFKTFEPGCHFTGVDRRTPPDLQITVPSSLTALVPPRRAPCSDLWPVPSISCYTRKFRPLNSARSPEIREDKLFDSSAGTGMAASGRPGVATSAHLVLNYFQTTGLTSCFEELRLPTLILTSGV